MHQTSKLLNYFALHMGFLIGWQADQSQSEHGARMAIPTEHKTVQARILDYTQEIGWTVISR
jgi:hypothetical protein